MSEHAKTMGAIAAGAFLGLAAIGGLIVGAVRLFDSNPESSRGAYRGREPEEKEADDSMPNTTAEQRMRMRKPMPPPKTEARAAKKSKKKKKKTKKKKKKIN